MFGTLDPNDEESMKRFREIANPQIDRMIRQAISTCWLILPRERQNTDEVEKEIRRVVDRALADLREDRSSFGLPNP